MEISKNTREFWKSLKIDDIIGLQDKQAIEDQMEEGKILGETDYEIKTIRTFKDSNGLSERLFLTLEREDEEIMMVVKIVDDIVEQRIFFKVDEFDIGNRQDILDRGDEWIFKEPEDPEDFQVSELEYADVIEQVVDEEEVEFNQLPQGELSGECKYNPPESGMGDIFMTISEYSTDVDCDNPFLLIIEEECMMPDEECEDIDEDFEYDDSEDEYDDEESYEDDEDDEEEDDDPGGVISLFLGADLSPLDFNVYRKGK